MNLSTCYLRVSECSTTNEFYEVLIISEREECIRFASYATEVVFIVLVNTFTLGTFATNHQLRKRSTYLIINLTVADLLFGITEGPLSILVTAILERYLPRSTEEWFSWQELMLLTLYFLFPVASLVKILLISLERLHVTKYPFKHCLIGGKVYFRIIATLFSVISVHSSIHPRRSRGGQSGREKRRDKSFQVQAEKPLGTDSHRTISKR